MVRNRVDRGIPPIHREPQIMKDLEKLANLPPRSPTESLSVLERDPARTRFLVSSKSGSTTEPKTFYAHFRGLVEQAGRNFIAVTDPETSLEHPMKSLMRS